MTSFPAIARSAQASAPAWNGTQQIGIVFVQFDARSGRAGHATPVIHAGVSTTTGPALYRSDDAGQTWQPLPGQPRGLRPTRMAQGSDGRLYIAYADLPGPDSMGNGALWPFDHPQGRRQDHPPVPQSRATQGHGLRSGAQRVAASH